MSMRSLWTAATGMAAQQTNMDVIANNLANANTVGFKRSRANFQDLMYENQVPAGAQTSTGTTIPTGVQIGMGTQTASIDKQFQQGSFTETDNNLDWAIQGNGFFQVLYGTQLVYTRNGSFKTDQNGNLTDANGYQLQPSIQVPKTATAINITPSGVFTATDATGKVLQTVQIQLYNFPNSSGLQSLGLNYYLPTQASGTVMNALPGGPEGMGTILQGYLESSNINVVNEMVNMILSQRTYEANSKVIKSTDDMLQMANNVVK